jgi:CRISPR/Cas system-associated endonuclease Cas3-HD
MSIWFVRMRVHTLKVLDTFIHTYTLILIITNAVLSQELTALVLILHTIKSGYNLVVSYGRHVCNC